MIFIQGFIRIFSNHNLAVCISLNSGIKAMVGFEAVVNKQEFAREYLYDNFAVLTTSFKSFIINVIGSKAAENKINGRISWQLKEFLHKNKMLFTQAVEDYENSITNNYPVRPYESVLNYTVTYNGNNLLSMYRDCYKYTGGAHGNTIREADTFYLSDGKVLPLKAFFPNDKNYEYLLLEEILRQARENYQEEPIYFENYYELIIENFNTENYYLTSKNIAIYFQQYEIAPYSSGIIVFEIPYNFLLR